MPDFNTNRRSTAFDDERGVSRDHHNMRLQEQETQRLQGMEDPGSGAPEYNAWAAANGADMAGPIGRGPAPQPFSDEMYESQNDAHFGYAVNAGLRSAYDPSNQGDKDIYPDIYNEAYGSMYGEGPSQPFSPGQGDPRVVGIADSALEHIQDNHGTYFPDAGTPDWGPNSENHPDYAAAMQEKQLNDRSGGMGQYGGHY